MSAVSRWKTSLNRALAEHPGSTGEYSVYSAIEKQLSDATLACSVAFQLASIDPTGRNPHVRSHIFRDFIYSSSAGESLPLLVTTTDIRTPKVAQITSNPHVELAWWIDGTKEQYRISGVAHIVPEPNNSVYTQFLHATQSSSLATANASPESAIALLGKERFDWQAKRLEVFKTMSGHMRASWCRPIPGSPLPGGLEEAKKWPETVTAPSDEDSAEEKARKQKLWDLAYTNFALLVIDPVEVDYVTMEVVPNRRWRNTKNANGKWDEQEVVA